MTQAFFSLSERVQWELSSFGQFHGRCLVPGSQTNGTRVWESGPTIRVGGQHQGGLDGGRRVG